MISILLRNFFFWKRGVFFAFVMDRRMRNSKWSRNCVRCWQFELARAELKVARYIVRAGHKTVEDILFNGFHELKRLYLALCIFQMATCQADAVEAFKLFVECAKRVDFLLSIRPTLRHTKLVMSHVRVTNKEEVDDASFVDTVTFDFAALYPSYASIVLNDNE